MTNKFNLPILVVFLGLLVACNNNKNSANTQSQQIPPSTTTGVDTIRAKPSGVALVKEGMNIVRYDNGTVKMEGNSKDGRRTGEWKSYFPSGQLQSDAFFTNGRPDGKVTVYYSNGKKMYEGENQDGNLNGIWTYWDDKGNVTRTVDYSKQPVNHR